MTDDVATDKQRQVLVAYLQTGSYRKAAAKLKINENTARSRIHALVVANGWKNVSQAAFYLGRGDF